MWTAASAAAGCPVFRGEFREKAPRSRAPWSTSSQAIKVQLGARFRRHAYWLRPSAKLQVLCNPSDEKCIAEMQLEKDYEKITASKTCTITPSR